MNDEEPLVVFKDNVLPLFVDSNVRIVCMSVFSWEGFGKISYFPIIVQPSNFKNLYVSLFMGKKKELKDFLQLILKKEVSYQKEHGNNLPENLIDQIIYEPIDNFDPLQYDEKESVTFLFSDKNVDIYKLASISQQILNPLGIGVFYQESFKSLKSIKSKDDLKISPNYHQAPFSMEIIDRLFYNPSETDSDINIIDAISLLCLQYPLRPLITPIDTEDKLRRRTIFSRITLTNPPSFFFKNNLVKYDSKKLIEPFTWVIVELDKKVHKTTYAVIVKSNKKSETNNILYDLKKMKDVHLLNLEPWNEEANDVCVKFKTQKVAIMSPYKGILKVYSDENDIKWNAEIYNAHF